MGRWWVSMDRGWMRVGPLDDGPAASPGGPVSSASSRVTAGPRSPSGGYTISMSTARPGAPPRSFSTVTVTRWPTTSRPTRSQSRWASARRRWLASARASRSVGASPSEPMARTRAPTRRAWAASWRSTAAWAEGSLGGRSRTSRSTERLPRSEPAMRSPSVATRGRTTTSQRRSTPRAAPRAGRTGREVQPCADGTGCLGLGHRPQGEGGGAARRVPDEGHRALAGQSPDEPVDGPEPGTHDGLGRGHGRLGERRGCQRQGAQGRHRPTGGRVRARADDGRSHRSRKVVSALVTPVDDADMCEV